MYYALDTTSIKDKKLKKSLEDCYIGSAALYQWELSINEHFSQQGYRWILFQEKLDLFLTQVQKLKQTYLSKRENHLKMRGCIRISGYYNTKNSEGLENAFINEIQIL